MRRVLTAAALATAALTLGTAPAAQAADLPKALDLGGLTAVDPGSLGDTVDGAARKATGLAGGAGSRAVKKAVPTAGKVSGKAVKSTTSAAQKAAGDVAGSAVDVLGETAGTATESGLPTDTLDGGLPARGLPLTGRPGR
ncbi:hypothetical protein BLA24_12805 [Streptomyces cinnamoneus]|uniref:Uncharacterized protein n=1 Tax=Streptomyces cinnamoneus TaxID=53446 RepID=A0A2G1XK04_STRCJ|nr:ATP-binding protein [Streptomyces cinnamoneus]PHQ51575.1 hypothetical protein BLA24_12805 [Streptomyces cinnamoneus]PPT14367.1 ATP-binding protein [Streptomyces cinnamoneus]